MRCSASLTFGRSRSRKETSTPPAASRRRTRSQIESPRERKYISAGISAAIMMST